MTDTRKEAAWDALMAYQQADMDGIMVLVSRQAIHECKDERDALRAQLQAARDGGAVEYVCPNDETALNYLDATYGNDMRCAVSCMIDAIRALKPTSAEGEG